MRSEFSAGAVDTAPAITTTGLTKRYRSRAAVDQLSLSVPRGVVAGFIGPNGAGKTTTMAMLLGLVRPSAGSGTVLGQDLARPDAYLHRVGALIESPSFWPGLTGQQNLRTLATLGGHDRAGIGAVLELVGLGDRGDDRFGEYSLGMKQRLGIAAALLGSPDLLVLDEPTNGLDPVGINEIRTLIGSLRDEQRTILVSSHLLAELEQVCDWLVVIDRGALVYQGPASGFLADGDSVVVVSPADPDDGPTLRLALTAAGREIRELGDAFEVVNLTDDPRSDAADIHRLAVVHDIVLAELHVRRPTLEAHYLQLVEGATR